jgi:hypothetical protein
MISRSTGEIGFLSGLHIAPHCRIEALYSDGTAGPSVQTRPLSLEGWKRHVLGFHRAEHGVFEVEALSADQDRILVVLMTHRHPFYESDTPHDEERRVFHEGIIHTDLAGQREFTWGEVLCRWEAAANKDWLVVAYSRSAKVPFPLKDALLNLIARDDAPE